MRSFGGERARKGLTCNALFGLGVPELVVIAGVAALVFGPKKLPEVGKSIGKTVKSFQQVRRFDFFLDLFGFRENRVLVCLFVLDDNWFSSSDRLCLA